MKLFFIKKIVRKYLMQDIIYKKINQINNIKTKFKDIWNTKMKQKFKCIKKGIFINNYAKFLINFVFVGIII